MIVFELSGPKLVPVPNFSSISLQTAHFSLFFGAKSCKIGLTDKFGHDGIFSRPLIIFISKIMQRNLEITFDSWEVTSSTKMTTIYTC